MTMSERFKRDIWPECRAILAVAFGLSLTLYAKRVVEKLVTRKVISKEVFEHGLKKPDVPAPASVPVPYRPSLFSGFTPGRTARGSGVTYVESKRYGRIPVHYTRTVEGKDHTLWDHDEELSPQHRFPCPLLRVDTACLDCEFFVPRGGYRDEPVCAARYKLENCPDQYFQGLDDIRNELENS